MVIYRQTKKGRDETKIYKWLGFLIMIIIICEIDDFFNFGRFSIHFVKINVLLMTNTVDVFRLYKLMHSKIQNLLRRNTTILLIHTQEKKKNVNDRYSKNLTN